jgi:hypothetical protein
MASPSCSSKQQMERAMPMGDIVLVGAIILAFGGFAIVLAWAERQTRGLHS